MREMGAYGLQVGEEYGGIGLSNTAYARMVEIVGGHDLGVGIHLGAHQSIGFKGILLFGTEEQKAKYLPKLASGEHVAAFTLTEPGAGSDAAGIKTRAVKDGDDWVLNGSKIWISNGSIAEIFTVFAKTEVTDPATGETKDKVTAFIVERSFGGLTSGPPENKMGIRCSNTAEVYLENVRVPAANVLGEVGGGFKVAMQILNNGRFGMGAALTGTMKKCVKGVAEHVVQRKQFGQTLAEFEGIQGRVADMAALTYASESLAYLVAQNMDRGMTDFQLEAAASKVFASEAAKRVTDETILVLGGIGFMKDLPYERYARDLTIFRIFEGANPLLRLFIALVGIQSAGKDLEGLSKAMKNPLGEMGTLGPAALSIAKARLGFPESPALDWVPSELGPARRAIEAGTGAFGAGVRELILKYRKKVIHEQLLLERVADAAIDIIAASACTSRAARAVQEKAPDAEHQVALANLFAAGAGARIADNVARFNPTVAKAKTEDDARRAVAKTVLAEQKYSAIGPLGF